MSKKCYYDFVIQITTVKHQVVFQPHITLIRASPLRCKKNVKEIVCICKYTHFKIDIFQPTMLLATGWGTNGIFQPTMLLATGWATNGIFQPTMLLATGWATNGIFQPTILLAAGWVNIGPLPKYAANFSFLTRFTPTLQNRELPVSTCKGKSFSREVKRPKLQANRSLPSVAEYKSVSHLLTNTSDTCINGMIL